MAGLITAILPGSDICCRFFQQRAASMRLSLSTTMTIANLDAAFPTRSPTGAGHGKAMRRYGNRLPTVARPAAMATIGSPADAFSTDDAPPSCAMRSVRQRVRALVVERIAPTAAAASSAFSFTLHAVKARR